MSIFEKIINYFDKPSVEEMAAYQHKLPSTVVVNHWYDKETGYYTARVESIDDKSLKKDLIITESKTADGLVEAINDAIFTYLDIPERMKAVLPKAMPVDVDFADKFAKKGSLELAK